MIRSLPSLTCAALVAGAALAVGQGGKLAPEGGRASKPSSAPQSSLAASRASLPDPGALVRSAVAALDAQQGIVAKIRGRAEVLGKSIVASGSYAQQGRGAERKLRLELTMQSGGRQHSVQQVVDGPYLRTYEDLAGAVTATRVDLMRVRQAVDESRGRAAAEVWLAVGGLPKLLQALGENFEFTTVEPAELDRWPVWRLNGAWRRGALAELLAEKPGETAGQPIHLDKLPKHLPEAVRLTLGRDDLFPYRIEFLRSAPAAAGGAGQGRGEARLLLVLEWFEVQLDAQVPARLFTFQPPANLQEADETTLFLERVGLGDLKAGGAERTKGAGK